MSNKAKPSVNEAKAGFVSAMGDLRPLQSLAEVHPLLLLGVAATAGVLTGSFGTRMLKKTGSFTMSALSGTKLPLAILSKLFL